MKKQDKTRIISAIRADLDTSELCIVCGYHGLSVADVVGIRNAVRPTGGLVKVFKNTLFRIAIKDTSFSKLSDVLKKDNMFFYSTSAVDLAKVVDKFANGKSNLVFKSAVFQGDLIDAGQFKVLASLPSMDELRAQILSSINAPATKLVSTINEPSSSLARVILKRSEAA